MAPQKTLRLLCGFLVAPLVPGLLVAGAALFSNDAWAVTFYISLSAKLGYPIAIGLGVPAYLWMTYKHWTGILHYITVGILLGIVAFVGAYLIGGDVNSATLNSMIASSTTLMPLAAISGVLATLAFWIVVRPDRKLSHDALGH